MEKKNYGKLREFRNDSEDSDVFEPPNVFKLSVENIEEIKKSSGNCNYGKLKERLVDPFNDSGEIRMNDFDIDNEVFGKKESLLISTEEDNESSDDISYQKHVESDLEVTMLVSGKADTDDDILKHVQADQTPQGVVNLNTCVKLQYIPNI